MMKRILVILAAMACSTVMAVSAYNPYAPNQFDSYGKEHLGISICL
jgi:hypothetical protein